MDLNFILWTVGSFVGDGGFEVSGARVFSGGSDVVLFVFLIYFADECFLFGGVDGLGGEVVV